MSGTIPAGAIIAMGGTTTTPPTGWLYCDGSAKALVGPYADLAAKISNNYGGDGVSVFNLPDLRGRFLRGTNHATARDPDANARGPSAPGGQTGDNVGSAQNYATGNPAVPFQVVSNGVHHHTVANVPAEDHHAAYGASGPLAYNVMEWTNDSVTTTTSGAHTHSVGGGDAETRPTNIYLDWLIAGDDLTGAPPIGSIMAFGGDLTDLSVQGAVIADGWYPCTGGKLRIADPKNTGLYNVIGKIYGGDTINFNLPDLRGYFVVGASTARKVGAIQGKSTTGAPKTGFVAVAVGDHTHQIGDIPNETKRTDIVAGWDLAENNSSATASTDDGAHTHAITSGGDAESRPLNVYVDYIIRFV
ncbi:MAG TPA: phage tail protein [Kofleriaceae bacterium]|jgi:microcystin-dependent protein